MSTKIEWKPLYGFEGFAEINLNGDVRTFDRIVTQKNGVNMPYKGRFLKIKTDIYGYKFFKITVNGIQRTYTVHTALYYSFVEPPKQNYDVHHINFDKTDNRLENLILIDSTEHKKLHSSNAIKASAANRKAVLQYTINGEFVAEYESVSEASRQTSICLRTINQCCNNYSWTDKNGYTHTTKSAGGYKWKFAS